MSDLKGSSGLEQATDMIVFLHRISEYEDVPSHFQSITEAIVEKNRNGPTGKFLLNFRGKFYRFDNTDYKLAQKYRNYIGG